MKELSKDVKRIRLGCHLLLSLPFLLFFNLACLVAELASRQMRFVSESTSHCSPSIREIVKMDIGLLGGGFRFYLSCFKRCLQSDLVLFSNFYFLLIICRCSKNCFCCIFIIILGRLLRLLLRLNEFFCRLKLCFLLRCQEYLVEYFCWSLYYFVDFFAHLFRFLFENLYFHLYLIFFNFILFE